MQEVQGQIPCFCGFKNGRTVPEALHRYFPFFFFDGSATSLFFGMVSKVSWI